MKKKCFYILRFLLISIIINSLIYIYSAISNKKKYILILFVESIIIYILRNKKIKQLFFNIFFALLLLIYPILSIFYISNIDQSTNYGWKKTKAVPVVGNILTESIFDPMVIVENSNDYKMYVSYRKKKSIAVCDSNDGINWNKMKICLENDEKSGWENQINRGTVLNKDGKYYMWYTGQKNDVSKIGLATSENGLSFEKYSESPVMEPELYYEKNSVMNPYVLFDYNENIFKMWYAAGEIYEPDCIGYATSEDGINWDKNKEPILTKGENGKLDSCKVGACEVHQLTDGRYIMFYIGYTDVNTARILFALSDDGVNWKRFNTKAIISGTKFGFDGDAVYKPTVYWNEKENKWYLWYNGRLRQNEFIGVATCDKYDFWNE